MPERWPEIPTAIKDRFAGLDLILHAGDVGELWVLDELSHLAPVVAVHGNDETDEASAALPYQQVICLAGQRVLLCHSHQPDRAAELASRKSGEWEPKLQRCVNHAQRHGAAIYVFGHTHIPMTRSIGGVLLVNPGAIASGNALCRQTVQSVAVLEIASTGRASTDHIRIDGPPGSRVPSVDCSKTFGEAFSQVSENIASQEVELAYRRARATGVTVEQELQDVVLRVARRCWGHELDLMSRAALLREAEEDDTLSPDLMARFRALLDKVDGVEDGLPEKGKG